MDHSGVIGRLPTLENLGRTRGRNSPGAHVVLDRDRHTGQWAGIPALGHLPVDLDRNSAGFVGQHLIEGVDVGLGRLNSFDVSIEDTVVITRDGFEILSAGLPRTVEEIEALMEEEGLLQKVGR